MSKKFYLLSSVLALVAILIIGWYAFGSRKAVGNAYGVAIDPAQGVVGLEAVFSDLPSYLGQTIIVEGKTGQVCEASGCWLIITDGSNQLFVQFYTFTVRPPTGSTVRVQGTLLTQNNVPYLAGEGLEILN